MARPRRHRKVQGGEGALSTRGPGTLFFIVLSQPILATHAQYSEPDFRHVLRGGATRQDWARTFYRKVAESQSDDEVLSCLRFIASLRRGKNMWSIFKLKVRPVAGGQPQQRNSRKGYLNLTVIGDEGKEFQTKHAGIL
jgi:hypothetical protein